MITDKLLNKLRAFEHIEVNFFRPKVDKDNPYDFAPIVTRSYPNNELIRIWDILSKEEIPSNLIVDSMWDFLQEIRIVIEDIKFLHEAVSFIKTAVPNWKYSVEEIEPEYGSLTEARVIWGAPDSGVKIMLRTTIENFPDSLKKEGCGFKMVDIPKAKNQMQYVCNNV